MITKKIKLFLCAGLLGFGFAASLTSCENGDIEFPDYEGGTTVYFPYQYPVRTIVLGDDEYDTSLDKAHKCQIKATFGGSYNTSNGSVQVQVDPSLVQGLTFADGTPVKAMPDSYYQLSTTTLNFNGSMYGTTEVQLSDAFFNDPDAVKETYVIPLVMTGQSGFGKILTGKLLEGFSGSRCDESVWDIKPMDYVLYCVKFQNKYSGVWLTHGTTSTADIEHAHEAVVRTKSLNSCIYTVSYQEGSTVYSADLLLDFNGDNCTISSLTNGVTATGNGTWGDDTEKKAWGNKNRDGMELNYAVDFGDGHKFATHEKMVWQRSGVVIEEFSPVYTK
ncbi:MAG: DUF1735 domain-containing protein [Prevotella sp.]|nr:DUF1735 domain-containing protein [Prevotella sp.]